MTALNRNPENLNFFQPTKFLLTFSRMSTVQYFLQEINIPGVSLGEVDRVTPFLDMYLPGTKLKYEALDISFAIDEELESWKSLYNWFTSIANPEGFEGRTRNREIQRDKNLSDATLTVLSALNNPILRIEFKNIFPLTMSDLQLDTKASAETIISCKATFRYESYKYLTL
jgi:hypothetical protein